MFLARSAPLYEVHGTLYGRDAGGVKVVAQPVAPLPYGHPNIGTFLASQLVRRLRSLRVVGLGECSTISPLPRRSPRRGVPASPARPAE